MYKITGFVVISFFLTGCESIAKNYLPDEIITQSRLDGSYITKEGLVDLSLVTSAKFDGSSNQVARNELIAKAVSLSDQKCTLHKAVIISNANAWNVGSGTAAILFAGASAIVSHARTASELAGAAAASTGVQSLVNKEIYADAMGTTILRSIEIGRTKSKAVIQQGMRNADYPISVALMDLQAYHDSCSLMSGLVEVTKAFDNRKPSRNELERDISVLKDEMTNLQTTLRNVDPALTQSILDKYAEEYKNKTLELSASED